MATWIPIEDTIFEHHKTRFIAKQLDISPYTAVGHMVSLWLFTLRNAWRDGDLSEWGEDGIAEAAGWTGDVVKFVTCLRESKFMDNYTIHNWIPRAGQIVRDRLRKERERSRKFRVKSRKVQESRGHSAVSDPIRSDPRLSDPRRPEPTRMLRDSFQLFYQAYPKKVAKKKAQEAWFKLKPNNGLVETILAGLEKAKVSEEWQRDRGQYIPYPASWLNGKRWEDDYSTPVDPGAERMRVLAEMAHKAIDERRRSA